MTDFSHNMFQKKQRCKFGKYCNNKFCNYDHSIKISTLIEKFNDLDFTTQKETPINCNKNNNDFPFIIQQIHQELSNCRNIKKNFSNYNCKKGVDCKYLDCKYKHPPERKEEDLDPKDCIPTVPCITWSKSGSCKYGSECWFLHN